MRDEKYYLGTLEPIVQQIADVNDDNSKIEIKFKFSTQRKSITFSKK